MDNLNGKVKRIVCEIPVELHSKFKKSVYEKGMTIREAIVYFIESYVEDDNPGESEEEEKNPGEKSDLEIHKVEPVHTQKTKLEKSEPVEIEPVEVNPGESIEPVEIEERRKKNLIPRFLLSPFDRRKRK